MRKIMNYYVNLYISVDSENNKPRVEIRRLSFLIWNLLVIFVVGIGASENWVLIIGKLIGILR